MRTHMHMLAIEINFSGNPEILGTTQEILSEDALLAEGRHFALTNSRGTRTNL